MPILNAWICKSGIDERLWFRAVSVTRGIRQCEWAWFNSITDLFRTSTNDSTVNCRDQSREWDDLLVDLNPVEDLVALIATAINEEAPLQITEGNVIKDGYNDQLDEYRDAMRNGKQWLAELEAKERQETGIKTWRLATIGSLVISLKSLSQI